MHINRILYSIGTAIHAHQIFHFRYGREFILSIYTDLVRIHLSFQEKIISFISLSLVAQGIRSIGKRRWVIRWHFLANMQVLSL